MDLDLRRGGLRLREVVHLSQVGFVGIDERGYILDESDRLRRG